MAKPHQDEDFNTTLFTNAVNATMRYFVKEADDKHYTLNTQKENLVGKKIYSHSHIPHGKDLTDPAHAQFEDLTHTYKHNSVDVEVDREAELADERRVGFGWKLTILPEGGSVSVGADFEVELHMWLREDVDKRTVQVSVMGYMGDYTDAFWSKSTEMYTNTFNLDQKTPEVKTTFTVKASQYEGLVRKGLT